MLHSSEGVREVARVFSSSRRRTLAEPVVCLFFSSSAPRGLRYCRFAGPDCHVRGVAGALGSELDGPPVSGRCTYLQGGELHRATCVELGSRGIRHRMELDIQAQFQALSRQAADYKYDSQCDGGEATRLHHVLQRGCWVLSSRSLCDRLPTCSTSRSSLQTAAGPVDGGRSPNPPQL